MVRPLRLEYEDAYYHVMNRGRAVDVYSMTPRITKPSCKPYQKPMVVSALRSCVIV